MLAALNEHVVDEGENYIITRPYKSHSDKDSLSILFYNNTEQIRKLAEKNPGLEETLKELKEFNDKAELLVNITGISGEYRMSRYKFSKDNILMSYKIKLGSPHTASKREKLTNRWATTPTVGFTSVTSVDTLSIQSYLTGFSAELILIDHIDH